MRKLLWAFGALFALSAAGALALAVYLGPVVKKAVEVLGPQVAGVPVRLGSFTVSPLTGRMRLKGLVVGNPPGFKTPSALEVGEVRVSVRLRTLLSDTVVVKEVYIGGASATYETGPGGSNVAVIQRKVDSLAGAGAGPEKSKAGGAGKKLRIEEFRFTGGKVRLSAKLLGGNAIGLPMPEIRLKDIGGAKGTTPAKAAAEIAAAVATDISKAALSLGNHLGPAVDTATKALSGIRKLFK